MLATKSGDGAISGIAPGISQTRRVELDAGVAGGVAPLRPEPAVVALGDGHHRRVERERGPLGRHGRTPRCRRTGPGCRPARWSARCRCGTARTRPCSSRVRAGPARRARGPAAASGPAGQLGLHRRQPGPVPLEDLHVAGVAERVGVRVGVAAVPPGLLEPPLARVPPARSPTGGGRGRRGSPPGRPGRAGRGWCRPPRRASPAPMPGRSTLPSPSGQPSASASSAVDVPHVAHREVVHLVAERGRRRSTARSAPPCWGTWRSRRCCRRRRWRRSRPARPA